MGAALSIFGKPHGARAPNSGNTAPFTRRVTTRSARRIEFEISIIGQLPYLEYIIVHEMSHLLVRRHDERFRRLMDRHFPSWEHLRQTLNNSPLAHSDWD